MLSAGMAMAIPSVRLCVLCDTCGLYQKFKTAKYFVEILLPPDSTIILVFVTDSRCLAPIDLPLTETPNTTGVRKMGDF